MSPARLPILSGRDAAKAFKEAGFTELPRRGKASHRVLSREEPPTLLTIPDHRELKRGTLRALIRQAGLTTDEFVSLL